MTMWAGISIVTGSEVAMNDVTISNNRTEGEVGAISNAGTLTLKNVRIYGNTADNYSAIPNTKSGTLNIADGVQVFNNNTARGILSEGILRMDFN